MTYWFRELLPPPTWSYDLWQQDKLIVGVLPHDLIRPTKSNPHFIKRFDDNVVTNLPIILKVKFPIS